MCFGLMLLAAQLSAAASPVSALDASELQPLLRVRPGATCLSVESLALQVEQWLYDEALPQGVMIDVEGSSSDPRSASFRVVAAGETLAHRAFEPGPARCEHLQATLGLAIALALKATLLEDLGEPLADDPQARAEGWSAYAGGLLSYRVLPDLAPGLELRTQRVLAPSWAVRVAAIGLLAQGIDLARTAGSFDAALIAARAELCVRAAPSRVLSGHVCAGLWAGALYAHGRGAGQVEQRGAVLGWFAFGDVLGLSLAITEHWSLETELGVSIPLRPLSIGVADRAGREVEVRSLPALGFTLGLGPSYRF